MTEKTLTFEALQIGLDALFRQMGYGDSIPATPVQEEVRKVITEVSTIVRPRFCYEVKRGILGHRHMQVGNVCLSIGSMIARQLAGSEAFAFFIATVGTEFEKYQRQLTCGGDMIRVYIADALGSLMAERCADLMEQSLQENIDKLGWRHTNRFSPGYCNWHLEEQPLLFSLIDERPCGVLLNDECLMTPIKSVSGIVGLGHDVERKDYACGLCMKRDCVYRKIKG